MGDAPGICRISGIILVIPQDYSFTAATTGLYKTLMAGDRKISSHILITVAGICFAIIMILFVGMINGEDTGTLLIATIHISFID